MADEIVSDATFGQNKGDEEEPIIVAQRFLNIFRQLHIFSAERREVFNKMILEQPPAVQVLFKNLPGGSILQDYIDELQGKKPGETRTSKSSNAENILQSAVAENSEQQGSVPARGGEIINSDAFAKILASSLAQSNAEIIRELQNNRSSEQIISTPATVQMADTGPLRLTADEAFSKTIANALAEAIANSDQKRQEDNKIIAQSFLELQENLNKMMEQNTQLKIISNSDAPGDVASAFQLKSVVDDMVKAQSKFLKETTQNQKEELSSIISVAIKESLKLSTQSLIDSFKQMDGDGPAPITYAASSPKNQASMGNVEEAIKAQGREFSSIIAAALRESQQNSAQAIIKTIESLKGTSVASGNSPKVEDIMKMQAELFRDIAKAQNQEFSALISAALQESQRQSTQAIIAALGQMQGRTMNYVPAPQNWTIPEDSSAFKYAQPETNPFSLAPTPVVAPEKDYSELDNNDILATENIDEAVASGKKKKKKKKKNRNNNADNIETIENDIIEDETPFLATPVQKKTTVVSALPEMPTVEDKPFSSGNDWGFGSYNENTSDNDLQEDNSWGQTFSDTYQNENSNELSDWSWDYQTEANTADEGYSEEGQDWEWDYEYEEVPEGEYVEGEEGQDWEWDYEYEEVEDEPASGFIDPEADLPTYQEDIVQSSEIILSKDFELVLLGMEDENYHDPYLENNESIGY